MSRTEYMPLMDKIIDEAEELAVNCVLLPDAYESQILDAISDIVGHRIHHNSTGAHLAIAAYRRIENLRDMVNGVVRV